MGQAGQIERADPAFCALLERIDHLIGKCQLAGIADKPGRFFQAQAQGDCVELQHLASGSQAAKVEVRLPARADQQGGTGWQVIEYALQTAEYRGGMNDFQAVQHYRQG
ncbi:hypothetical protein D9M71_469000 [compost metagenome]